ncbi:MAG: S8 family serine peptidase [Acidobacteriota bacterium]|nr:S8 family serine peptidase [Acidobacteriota bacterium]
MARHLFAIWLAVTVVCGAAAQAAVQRKPDYRIRLETATFDPLERMRKTAAPSAANAGKAPATGWYLVQFDRIPTEAERKVLQQKYRLQLRQYVPNFAYLERLTPATIAELTRDPLYRAHVPYSAELKVSRRIGRTGARKEAAGIPLTVVFFSDADAQAVAKALQNRGRNVAVTDNRQHGGALKAKVTVPSLAAIREIAKLSEVRWIEEDLPLNEDNGNTAGVIQSGTSGVTPIWDVGIHGENQIIGIMDSGGPDLNHCAFIDNADNTVRPDHRKVVGFRPADAGLGSGHGAFTAGTAAGDDVNNLGTGANRGMAWAARLSFDLFNDDVLPRFSSERADGAMIHTNSWHRDDLSYSQIAVDTDTFLRNNEGSVIVGSSGNSGESLGPPGTAKNAIDVSATDDTPDFGDGNDGPTADGRRKPDLMARGCSILSVTSSTTCTFGPRQPCATSYATPAVAGAAALVRQYFMEGFYPTGTRQAHDAFVPTGALIKAALLNSTADVAAIPGYPSDTEGWGLVQLDRVLPLPGSARNVRVWDTPHASGFVSGGAARSHVINVASAAQPLRVTLVYTDQPGAVGAANSLVNDLDLTVTSPDGTQVFLGNQFAGGVSATGGAADNVNNVEMVVINNPAVGNWMITVAPATIAAGPQGYALVASADFPEVPPPTGNQNTLVVRANFSNIAVPSSLANVQSKMANVAAYVNTISYGQATILPEYRQVALSQPTSFYYHPSRNLLIEMGTEVVQTLLAAEPNLFTRGTADPGDDFRRMVIVTNDTNFTADWATTGAWPYDLPGGVTQPISVSIQSDANDDARFAHGIAHQFGLVDLYAHPNVTFPRAYADEWDNMAQPFRGQQPLVWEKERASWLTLHGDTIAYVARPTAATDQTFTVSAQESAATNRKAIAVGLTPGRTTLADEDQFYMIEVRDQTATAESTLPSSGVLIYLVNELVPQGEGPVILRDRDGGTPVLEAFTDGDAVAIPGTGITVTVLSGPDAGQYDIRVQYTPPVDDYNVRITRGDTIGGQFYSWFSPDIWLDSPLNGENLASAPPPNDAPERPVVGVVNKIRVRISTDAGIPAENFDVRVRISQPHHTVGNQTSFDTVVGIQHLAGPIAPNTSQILTFDWTPIDTGEAHSCVWVEFLNLTGTDRNANDNAAQENLEKVTSVTGSPFHPTDFNFNIENPYDEPSLFYFRVNGAPANWTVVKSPDKALLNPGQRLEGKITFTPPPDEKLCSSRVLEVTAWTPRGDTLIPVGGSVVQVDMRRPTKLTLDAGEGKCRGADFGTPGVTQRNCRRVTTHGCTDPPQPNQTIWIRYVSQSGEVVWHQVTTDANGCFDDFFATGDSSVWTATAGFEGNDCQGPAETSDPSRPGKDAGGNGIPPIFTGRGVWYSLHLGHNFPLGDFRRDFASGPSITADFERSFRDRYSIYAMLGYHYFDAKFAGGGETYLTNLSLNLRVYGSAGPWHPFLGFGPGVYRIEGGSTKPGLDLAAGLEFPIVPKLKLEIGADLHRVNVRNRLVFVDAKLGVKWTF